MRTFLARSICIVVTFFIFSSAFAAYPMQQYGMNPYATGYGAGYGTSMLGTNAFGAGMAGTGYGTTGMGYGGMGYDSSGMGMTGMGMTPVSNLGAYGNYGMTDPTMMNYGGMGYGGTSALGMSGMGMGYTDPTMMGMQGMGMSSMYGMQTPMMAMPGVALSQYQQLEALVRNLGKVVVRDMSEKESRELLFLAGRQYQNPALAASVAVVMKKFLQSHYNDAKIQAFYKQITNAIRANRELSKRVVIDSSGMITVKGGPVKGKDDKAISAAIARLEQIGDPGILLSELQKLSAGAYGSIRGNGDVKALMNSVFVNYKDVWERDPDAKVQMRSVVQRMYQQGVPLSQHVIQFAGVNPYMMGAGMTPMMNTGMTTGIGTGMVTPVVDSVGVPIAHTTMMSGVMPGVMPGMMGPAPQKPEGAGAVSLIGGEASLNKQRQNEALKRLRGDPFKAVEGDMKQATRFMGGSTEEKQGLYVQSLAAFREFIRDLKFKIKVQKKIDEGMKTRIENFYEDAKGRIAESWMSPNPMTWDEDSVREAYVKAFSELRRTVVFQHLSDEIQKKMVESIDDVERHSKFFMASNFMSYLADLTAKINNRIGFMGAPGTKRERKAQFQIGVEALSKELREDRPYLTDIQAFDRVCELIETSKERMGWSALNPLGWKNEQLYGSVYRLFEAAKKHDKFWKMLKEKNPELKEMIDEFKPLAKEESEGHHADFFVLKDYAFGKAKDKMFTDTGISSFEFQRKKTDQLNYYESHKGQIENIKTMVFAATDNSKNDEEQQRIFRNGLIELEKEIKLNGELMDNRVIASVKAMLTKAADMLDWRYEVGGEWEDQVLYQAFSRALTAIKDNKSLSKKFMGTREMELLDEALEKAGSTKSILKQDIQRQRDMGPELRREF